MLIEEPRTMRRARLLRSPLPLALLALAGCASMVVGLLGTPSAPAAAATSLSAVTVLHAAGMAGDQRFAFVLVLAGFLVMAVACFALSRRSFRDALKAESQRKR